MDPKVGEHKGQPSFSGLERGGGSWSVSTVWWARLGWEAVRAQAGSPQKDPRDQSM